MRRPGPHVWSVRLACLPLSRPSPLPVPEPSFTVPEQGVLAYRKPPGRPLLDLPQRQRSAHASSIAATLGELLTALHDTPAEHMAALVGIDDQRLAEWRDKAAQTQVTVAEEVPVAHRRPVEARSWTLHRRPRGGCRCSPTTILGSSMS
jgi:hypothetical protein